jgi:hypothetical protein
LFMALSNLWILHWDLTPRFSSTPQKKILSRKTHSALTEKISTLSIVAQFAECKFAKNEVLTKYSHMFVVPWSCNLCPWILESLRINVRLWFLCSCQSYKDLVLLLLLHSQDLQLGCLCREEPCSPHSCDHVSMFDNDNTKARDIHGQFMCRWFPYDSVGRIIVKVCKTMIIAKCNIFNLIGANKKQTSILPWFLIGWQISKAWSIDQSASCIKDEDVIYVFQEGYMIYECNSSCCCWEDCENCILQNGVRVKLEVFKSRHNVLHLDTHLLFLFGKIST